MDSWFRRLLEKHPELAIIGLAAVAVPFLVGLGVTRKFYEAGAYLRGRCGRQNPGVPSNSIGS